VDCWETPDWLDLKDPLVIVASLARKELLVVLGLSELLDSLDRKASQVFRDEPEPLVELDNKALLVNQVIVVHQDQRALLVQREHLVELDLLGQRGRLEIVEQLVTLASVVIPELRVRLDRSDQLDSKVFKVPKEELEIPERLDRRVKLEI